MVDVMLHTVRQSGPSYECFNQITKMANDNIPTGSWFPKEMVLLLNLRQVICLGQGLDTLSFQLPIVFYRNTCSCMNLIHARFCAKYVDFSIDEQHEMNSGKMWFKGTITRLCYDRVRCTPGQLDVPQDS